MRAITVALMALCSGAVLAMQNAEPQFEVASIKRNTSGEVPHYLPPGIRPGQFSVINMTMRDIVQFGYPARTRPALVLGLPAWAESDGYDVMARLTSTPTPAEQQQMWRTLLTERVKLQAHYETRERAGYALVLAKADKRLGAELQPSTLDCAKPPAPLTGATGAADRRVTALMGRCLIGYVLSTSEGLAMYSGGTSLPNLALALSAEAGRPVVDRTALTGNYALSLRFASDQIPSPAGLSTADIPGLFTAVQEQLGLKLEPTTIDGQVLVIDHIERPTEN